MFGTNERCHVRTQLTRAAAITAAAIAIAISSLFIASPALAASTAASPIVGAATCSSTSTIGCVQGTLRDDNGNGVAKVTMTLSDASGDKASTKSDKNGTYVFKVHATGQYTLTLVTKTLPKGVKAATPTITITATVGQLQPAVIHITGKAKGSVDLQTAAPSYALQVWDQFSQGLLLGLLLALASIGLSLIYGTTGLSNFAHAEQVTSSPSSSASISSSQRSSRSSSVRHPATSRTS